MCIYGGHMCICIPNLKFLCFNQWQGDDTDNEAPMMSATTHDNQSMIVYYSLVDKPNEPKTHYNAMQNWPESVDKYQT